MLTYYVYITTNLVNGKQYIGERTCNKADPNKDSYLGSGVLFKQKLIEYGKENFKKEILEFFVNKLDAFNAQEKYIKLYKTHVSQGGYNKSWKGGHNVKGCWSEESKKKCSETEKGKISPHKGKTREQIMIELYGKEEGEKRALLQKERAQIAQKNKTTSDETKQKLSNSHKGKIISDEHRKKISNSLMGKKRKPFTEEHKERIREARKKQSPTFIGRIHSDESKKLMSDSHKGKFLSEEHKKNISISLKKLKNETKG